MLRRVADRLQQLWTRVLAATEKEKGEKGLPRIIRLSRRFTLTEKETKAMVYAFCNQVSRPVDQARLAERENRLCLGLRESRFLSKIGWVDVPVV